VADGAAEVEAAPEPEPKPEPVPPPPFGRGIVIIKPDVLDKRATIRAVKPKDEEEEEEDDEGAEPQEVKIEYIDHEVDIETEIVERLTADGFKILKRKRFIFSKFMARQFYRQYAAQDSFANLTSFISTGPVTILHVERRGCIDALATLAGDIDPTTAREASAAEEDSRKRPLRALFGTTELSNAVHVSNSDFSARREASILFPASFTREKTFFLIKPDGMPRMAEIKEALAVNEFAILAETRIPKGDGRIQEFFAARGATENQLSCLELGSSQALLLESYDAINRLNLLVGPEDVESALVEAAGSIRATFGKTPSNGLNVVYCSPARDPTDDTVASVTTDVAAFFPGPLALERTLAMIKPNAVNNANKIQQRIVQEGFTIMAQQRVQFTRELAELFYAEHANKRFFDRLCTFMSSGPSYVLVLSKPGAIKHWRMVAGPTNPKEASESYPDSLRALYGSQTNMTANAVHGSANQADAEREIGFFFPNTVREPVKKRAAAKEEMKTCKSALDSARSLHSVLVEGLTELCKQKPAGLAAIRQLGNWLLQNNPNQPAPTGPSTDVERAPTALSGRAPINAGVEIPLMDDPIQNIVFTIGGPGSHLPQHCSRIAKEFGHTLISTSELLRAEMKRGSVLGKEIESAVQNNELVPTEIIVACMKAKMKRSGSNKFLIQGYPRTLEQAFAFERNIAPVNKVLYFECNQQVQEQRLLGIGYNDEEDVKEEQAKIAIFYEKTSEVVTFYQKAGNLVTINDNVDQDQSYPQVHRALIPDVVFIMGDNSKTIAKHVLDGFGWTLLSIDQLLRDEIASGSRQGREIGDMFGEDRPIPISIQVELLDRAMDNSAEDKFIVHDFPTTLQEAIHFEKIIGSPAFILNLGQKESDPEKQAVIDFYTALASVREIDTSQSAERVRQQVNGHFIPSVQFVLSKNELVASKHCENARALGYTILSHNDLLRAEVARQSKEGIVIEKILKRGQIIPTHVIMNLLGNIISSASPRTRFLINSFPRALDQAQQFEASVAPAKGIVYLDMTDETALAKLAEEGADHGAGKKVRVFMSQTMPVVSHYAAKGMCDAVNANQPEDAVSKDLADMFTPDVVLVIGAPSKAKDEVCERLQTAFRFTHIDFDAITRREMARPTPIGIMLKSMMSKNKVVPTALKTRLISQAIQADGGSRFVVSNFPTSLDQLRAFKSNVCNPLFVLHLDANEENMKQGILTKQPDLSEEDLTQKVTGFAELTMDVIKECADSNLVRRIDANFDVDHMIKEITPYFRPILVPILGSSLSGKNIVATFLGLKHGFCRVDVKKLLADEASTGSASGQRIATYLKHGRTVPTELTLPLIREFILSARTSKFLLDGYPRLMSAGYPMAHDQVYDIEDTIAPIPFAIHCDAEPASMRNNAKSVTHFEDEQDNFAREYGPVLDYLGVVKPIVKLDTTLSPGSGVKLKEIEKQTLITDSIEDQLKDLSGEPQKVLQAKYNC